MLWKLYLSQCKKVIVNKLWLLSVLFLYFLYLILLLEASSIMNRLDMFTSSNLSIVEYFKYPLCVSTAIWFASYFSPLWMIFIIVYLGQDWNKVSIGPYSYRRRIFVGKAAFAYSIPFVCVLTALLAGLIMWIHWGKSDIQGNFVSIGALWLQLVAYVSFALLLLTIFKSSGKAVLAFLGYFVLEAIVRKLLFSMNVSLGFYLPAKVITSLIVPPAANYVDVARFADFFELHSIPFGVNAFLSVFYSILFLLISIYLNFKTKER